MNMSAERRKIFQKSDGWRKFNATQGHCTERKSMYLCTYVHMYVGFVQS